MKKLGQAHHRLVDKTAVVAGGHAHQQADQDGDDGRGGADGEGRPPADKNSRQHIAAKVVGAERRGGVRARLGQRRPYDIKRVHSVNQRPQQRCNEHDDKQRQPDNGCAVAPKDAPKLRRRAFSGGAGVGSGVGHSPVLMRGSITR